jgi:predicted dehydrogenase
MKQIKTGIIGVGFIGAVHIETLRRLGFINITAICDPIGAKAKAEALHIEKYYSDYKEMIAREDLDFIHICTPNNTHFEIASYAISHNINVILEKPMTVTIEEAEKLVELVEKYHVIAAINFHNWMYPATHFLKEQIKTGKLGDIISVHGSYLQDWLLYDTDYSWRLISSESGNTRAIADIGSHWIDLVEYTTGLKVSEVMADFSTVYKTRKKPLSGGDTFSVNETSEFTEIPINTEDMSSLLLRFSNGALGSCFISQMFAGKKNKIQLFVGGTESSAEWDLDDSNNLIFGHRNSPNETITKDASLMGQKTAGLISYPPGHGEGFADAIKQNFNQIYNKYLNRELETDFATFKDGLREMILCEKILESSQKQKFIKIN